MATAKQVRTGLVKTTEVLTAQPSYRSNSWHRPRAVFSATWWINSLPAIPNSNQSVKNTGYDKSTVLILCFTGSLYSTHVPGNEDAGAMANAEPGCERYRFTPSGNDAAGSITASGQVEAVQTANISTRGDGYITAITVKQATR